MIKTALSSAIFILLAFCPVFGQKQNIPSGGATVLVTKNSFCLDDGIKDLVKAFKFVQRVADKTYCYPTDWPKISGLNKELADPGLAAAERRSKESQLSALLSKREEYFRSEAYIKHEKGFGEKILDEIELSLKQAALDNNLTIIDLDELDINQLLAIEPKADITGQFIKYFNKKQDKARTSFKPEIKSGRLAAIDTTAFFDKQKGISAFINSADPTLTRENACSRSSVCKQIGEAIQSYSVKNGIILVLDSSKGPLPAVGVEFEDITLKFIAEFNNNHK